MQSKSRLVIRVAALVLPLACSEGTLDHATGAGGNGPGSGGVGGMAGKPGDDLLFVPDGLPNTQREGEIDVTMTLVAFTLVQGATGPALYAAVRNDGPTPACQAGMVTTFFDKAGQLMTSAGSALQSRQLYRLDAGGILPCIDPGQIAMAASTDLPEEIVIEQLGSLQHTFPFFIVDGIVPIAELTVSGVQTVTTGAGSAYTGTLTNGLDVTASAPSVTIFPVNRVGRPLGAATSSATTDIPPGGSWTFATSTVDDPGVGYAAYPSASIPN